MNSIAIKCVPVLAYLIDVGDVWVVERGSRFGFLHEAAHAVGVLREFGRQQFQGDLASQPRIFSQPHFAHPARAEFTGDLIVRNGLSDHVHLLLVGTSRFNSSSQLKTKIISGRATMVPG